MGRLGSRRPSPEEFDVVIEIPLGSNVKYELDPHGRLTDFIAGRQALLRRANDVIRGPREHWLKIHIDKVLPLAEADQAHRLLENRDTVGTILRTQPRHSNSRFRDWPNSIGRLRRQRMRGIDKIDRN